VVEDVFWRQFEIGLVKAIPPQTFYSQKDRLQHDKTILASNELQQRIIVLQVL
jgi:hypothetical protein